jgi:hypothetical protein
LRNYSLRKVPAASLLALSIALSLVHHPALAQGAVDAPPPEGDDSGFTEDEIVVIAQSLRGTVQTPQPPILELGEADIAAYGSGSISELIEALSPSVGGGSGRGGGFPVVLVNGVRISSFRELRSYPPEAIEKVEVLAAETAQQFGYSPDERVVNIVLKRSYASREVEVEYGQPWDGGNSSKQAEATYLQIAGQSRINFNLGWQDESLLTEAERGITQSVVSVVPGDPDQARYRSLVADTAGLEATANFTTRIGSTTSVSVNGAFERSDSLRLQGLDTVQLLGPLQGDGTRESRLRIFGEDNPLSVDSRTTTYSLGTTVDTMFGGWQLTATADGNHRVGRNLIDRRADVSGLLTAAASGTLALDDDLGVLPDAGFDRADSKTDTLNSLVTATGRPLLLPGGELTVTLDTGYNYTRIQSEDTRNPGITTSLKRGDLSGGVNLGIPITSRREDFGAALGDISLNLQGGINHLSDFGTLTDWTVGLNWGITESLSINASRIVRDAAPSLAQLGDPEIATVNVPIFDLTRGETVLATVISGGNPLLPAQTQRDWRFSLNWQLPEFTDAIQQGRVSLELFKNHSEDVASGFPVLTPVIEAAFPGRVTRDAGGRILSIDQRPVTFAEQDSTRLQVGLFFTGPFGAPRAQAQQPNNPLQAVFRPGNAAGNAAPAGANAPAGAPAESPGGAERPEGRPRMDPERMAQLRQQVCGQPGSEPAPITEEQLAALPAPLLERLKGPDGKVDPERVNQLRERFCSGDLQPGQRGEGQRSEGAGGDGPQAGSGRPQGGNAGFAGEPGAARGAGGGPRGAGGGNFRGPGGPGGSADGRGRWFLNLNYGYQFENEVLIAPGGPLLDLLDGGAISGSQPRHQGQFNLGVFYAGFGAQANGRYTGASRIAGSGLPGGTDLFFEDYAVFNLRVFADLNQRTRLIEQIPLLKNTRVTFSVDNLFDTRQRVTDSAGVVPLRYQPFLIDPVGRSFEIELRKLF